MAAATSAATLAAQSRLRPEMRLQFDGLGPLKIGMTVQQVRTTFGAHLDLEHYSDFSRCAYLRPAEAGLSFMILQSRLARIDVWSAGKRRTVAGAGVGTTESELRRLYGKSLTVGEHPYNESGIWKYMTVRPTWARYRGLALLFETDGQRVTCFRAGTEEAVALAEGCS